MKSMTRRQWLSLLAASAPLAACDKLPLGGVKVGQYKALDISGSAYNTNWRLTDMNGESRSLQDFAGKVVAVFFGFTQCPDVCPTTLFETVQAKKLLGADADKLQVVFVTVDPERDTPELLREYMAAFDPQFLALRPTPEELRTLVAPSFKVYYKRVDSSDGKNYTMDHSAGTYLIDKKGKVRLHANYGTKPEDLVHDIKLLLAE